MEIALAYSYMGIIQVYGGDQYGGQESLLKSLTYLQGKDDPESMMANYHELGNICLNLKNYDAALNYYQKTLQYISDPNYKSVALNSIALTYQKKGDYDKAIKLYQSLLAKSTEKKTEYARLLSNYAKTKWLKDPKYPASSELNHALKIRKDSNDTRGLNASYAHLTDYYSTSRPDSALYYAKQWYTTTRELNNADDEVEALSKLIALSPPQEFKTNFMRYEYLTDSIQSARNAAKNQFALIRYEAEKNKSDNLQLQKDNAQKELQLIMQRLALAASILLLVLAIYWYRKRRRQIEAASRQAIQEHQLATSQKVHDVVANGLYRIMTHIEHNEAIDKELLIDKIEDLYERSRDISYETPAISLTPFHEKIDLLMQSFASEQTRVGIVGNAAPIWDHVHPQAQPEVEHILQELMINMKKHSQAQNVLIKFEHRNNQVHIHYSDDGVGISPQVKYGNGLLNTGNRIEKIGGHSTFEHSNRGLKIHIYFPTAHSS
ncbi:tetratricopeptide repeat protein [Chitinophaga sedimenti]|uniref:tetratricopeptide repeat-containing sensor histidine kinase n=1 Tax=Chitinophaga sedimenti TaxID=2033606 RepID=UPI002003DCE5|nr:tetratricopeptide repeat-containing sensor histidine kinase [Chitinophaga sedimenti]MCK7553967.1 tetratricopeptide repeat protein [Chitinophaga sedimenti]